MQRSTPDCSAGFSRFEASIAPPLVAPAPITVWISSMKRIAFGCASSSFITAFSRSSKSPRYRVPASSAPMSSEKIVVSASTAGVSPSTILRASPSAIAVLPTPGSPTSSGLFFRRRQSTWMHRSTSRSRPISGSTSPRRAFSFRSTQYFCNAVSSASLDPWDCAFVSGAASAPLTGRASP